jgi:hypothetical protein
LSHPVEPHWVAGAGVEVIGGKDFTDHFDIPRASVAPAFGSNLSRVAKCKQAPCQPEEERAMPEPTKPAAKNPFSGMSVFSPKKGKKGKRSKSSSGKNNPWAVYTAGRKR